MQLLKVYFCVNFTREFPNCIREIFATKKEAISHAKSMKKMGYPYVVTEGTMKLGEEIYVSKEEKENI